MKTSEILIAAKAKIDTPEKWTQGSYAADYMNNPVDFETNHNSAACKFCSLGAIRSAYHASNPLNTYDITDNNLAAKRLYEVMGCCVDTFNDNNTHEAVMLKFDEAITLAQQMEAK